MKKYLLQQCYILLLLSVLYSCSKESVGPVNGGQSSANATIYTAQLTGIYEKGVPLDTTNYITVYLNANAAGDYSIATALQNGYKFSASGKFTTSGAYTIKLMGSGTPTTEEMDSIKISTSVNHYNKIGIQVVTGLSNKIILATAGDDFANAYHTVAITGRNKLLWKIPGYARFATVNKGMVYFSNDYSFKAVNIATGDSVWSNAALKGLESVTYSNQVLYVTGGSTIWTSYSVFAAIDAATGKTIWSYNPNQGGYVSMGAPIVGSNVVVFQKNGMYALDKATGALVWSNTVNNVNGTPVLSGNTLYATSGYGQGTYAFDINTGKVLWQNTVDTYGSIVLDNGKLYANGQGYVYCFDAATGKTLWTSIQISDLTKSPVLSNGKVYVTTDFGFTSVYAFDAATGAKLWTAGSTWGFAESELVTAGSLLWLGNGGSLDSYYTGNGTIVAYTYQGTPLAMDYAVLMAVYDTDTQLAAFPAENGEN